MKTKLFYFLHVHPWGRQGVRVWRANVHEQIWRLEVVCTIWHIRDCLLQTETCHPREPQREKEQADSPICDSAQR